MSGIIKKYHSGWIKSRSDAKTQKYLNERVFETMVNLFSKIINKEFSGKLLDIGCGEGGFVRVCNERKLEAAGTDINDRCNFEADTLPYPNNEFDIVFMYSVKIGRAHV